MGSNSVANLPAFLARSILRGKNRISAGRGGAAVSQFCRYLHQDQVQGQQAQAKQESIEAPPAWRTQSTTMTSSEAFVETMVAHETDTVFGIVGSAFMDALDIFPGAGIRFVSVQHEQNAVHMADGFSRVTNRPGVCIAQNGPGITNFVTGVAAAYWAHSPVVVITPETGSLTNGLGGFQETNQLPIFSEITKYQAHVCSPKRMAEFTNRCFNYAMLERGPVQLNIPRDMFYGDVQTKIPAPARVEIGAGGPQDLKNAAELLATAKNPVIVAGGGVVIADGVEEVVKLAEQLQAPVCTTYLHNDAFPKSHNLLMGPLGYQGSKAAMKVISEADVVFALGTRLGPFGSLPQYEFDYWPKNAKIIQVDIASRRLGLTKDVDIGICGDAKLAAIELSSQLSAMTPVCLSNAVERVQKSMAIKDDWEAELTKMSVSTEERMAPRHALRELERAMPKNAMVSTDIGNICSVSNSYLRFDQPRSFFAAMSFGNCGYAFPCAMGAKLGAPERPSIAYVGDGAWGMSLNEVMTCVRENIPAIAVVFNNEQWGAEKKNQVDFYKDRFVGTNLVNNPSFAEISRTMGAEGIKVTNPDEIGDALNTLVQSGKPGVLEIAVSQVLADPFRRDALAMPIRHLDKYKTFV